MSVKMPVYLDYNATTPVDPHVQEAICKCLRENWANPSSPYEIGREARNVIDDSRRKIAEMIGAASHEIVFTSGGTESNHMVIQTAIQLYRSTKGKPDSNAVVAKPHIITTNIEHDSIKLPLEKLAKEDEIEVSFVAVSKSTGAVSVEDIVNEIRGNTCLVTVMLANNETGVIQPVRHLKSHLKTLSGGAKSSVLFHTDAAQAIGKIAVNVQDLNVDYLTIVGHKFYGPRIGALYFRHGGQLCPTFYGGGQEQGIRPGTENTAMIAGLGMAADLVCRHIKEYSSHMNVIREYLKQALNTNIENVIFHVDSSVPTLPNTVSVAFDYELNGRELLLAAEGVFASTGAACHSDGKPSGVLVASGVSQSLAMKTLRLSVGRETTKEDIDFAVSALQKAIKVFVS